MSAVSSLSNAEKEFLRPYLPSTVNAGRSTHGAETTSETTSSEDRSGAFPFVTLTYASSLDGMISLAPGTRTTLSGPETKSMTHYLRVHHDAILVGVGTAVADDPSLNCRYPGATFDDQPTPVIIDPKQRLEIDRTKVYSLAVAREGKVPILLHSQADGERQSLEFCDRISIGSETDTLHGQIPWPAILKCLKSKGITSVMIEGGATVISDLMSTPELVDSVIVTIAPTWLGQGGVTIAPSPVTMNGARVNAARLRNTSWRQFGQDAVLCGFLQSRTERD